MIGSGERPQLAMPAAGELQRAGAAGRTEIVCPETRRRQPYDTPMVPPNAASGPPPEPPARFGILGTAGHIDHGKSSLVKALTGVDPDRLPEEKARGMTIELGFARLELPGVRLGVVDVPGHERFVRTMVSGATGIDIGLLVVAADDGVMPQTREHVDILTLLGVHTGVIALNKADLAGPDQISHVARQVAELVAGTPLSDWCVLPVSAVSGAGLDELREELGRLARLNGPAVGVDRTGSAVFRLAIDRVFAVAGRGTVVTGSVIDGSVAGGAAVDLLPAGRSCRVREVQSHGSAESAVRAGQRAALNLTGVDREMIERGMELATPGYLTPTRYVDVRLQILSRSRRPLESFQRVRVCMAAREALATTVVLGPIESGPLDAARPADASAIGSSGSLAPGAAAIAPGTAAWVQLRFEMPVVAAHGQRFIVRDESAQATLGGGVVLRPVSRRLSRRDDAEACRSLRLMEQDDAAVRAGEALRTAGFETPSDFSLACRAGVQPADAARLREALARSGELAVIGGGAVHRAVLSAARERGIVWLRRNHAAKPGQPGVPVERFAGWLERRTSAAVGKALFAALQSEGEIVALGPFVAHRSHRPALSPEDSRLLEACVAELAAAGLDPPELARCKCAVSLSKQRLARLVELARTDARLVLIAPQHFASAEAVARFKSVAAELGQGGRRFKLSDVRDALGLSRRPVQTMLEYLDRVQYTRRVGDERVVAEAASRSSSQSAP